MASNLKENDHEVVEDAYIQHVREGESTIKSVCAIDRISKPLRRVQTSPD